MKRERIVEFVGGSEDEIAFLRLMLRKAARELTDKWRLRREDDSHVDLLIIPDLGDAGAAPQPAAGEGVQRRVRLIDPVFGAAGMETTLWPLPLEQIVKLLNLTSVAGEMPRPGESAVIQQNVYDDLFEPDPTSRWHGSGEFAAHIPTLDFNDDWAPPPRAPESELMLQAEQLFRKDPHEPHLEILKAIRLHDHVDIEATEGRTTGGDSRMERRDAAGNVAHVKHKLSSEEADARHALASYLTGRLLPGPARIETAHVVLTLDPRNRQFYAKGALFVFEDCCKQVLRRGDWRDLSSTEFAQVKSQLKPRAYAELHWLCVYVDDRAYVAAELGADTRYRLIQNLQLQSDYPRAARVAQALESRCTLAAAAITAGVSLAEAQRVAHAFDVVGFLIPD